MVASVIQHYLDPTMKNIEFSIGSLVIFKSVKFDPLKGKAFISLESVYVEPDSAKEPIKSKQKYLQYIPISSTLQIMQFVKVQINNKNFKCFHKMFEGDIKITSENDIYYPTCPYNCKSMNRMHLVSENYQSLINMDQSAQQKIYQCRNCYKITSQPNFLYFIQATFKNDFNKVGVTIKDTVGRKLFGLSAEVFKQLPPLYHQNILSTQFYLKVKEQKLKQIYNQKFHSIVLAQHLIMKQQIFTVQKNQKSPQMNNIYIQQAQIILIILIILIVILFLIIIIYIKKMPPKIINQINMQLSQIDQFFLNQQILNIDQSLQLKYRIVEVKQKGHLGNFEIYIVTLSDNKYYFPTYFYQSASHLIHLQFQEETKSINDIRHALIKIKKWKLSQTQQFSYFIVIVYEFEIIGEETETPQLIEYKIGQEIKSKPKLQIKIQKAHDVQKSILKKSIKQEASFFEGSSFNNHDSQLDFLQINITNSLINSIKKPEIIHQKPNMITDLQKGMKKWILEGRIVFKSPLTKYIRKYDKSEGEFFKILIMDINQDIITGVFYDKCFQKFFDFVQDGKIYSFQNANIKDNIDGTKTINFFEYSVIKEIFVKEMPLCPKINEEMSIQGMSHLEQNTIVDLIGVVSNEIGQKDDNIIKRTLLVVDQTGQIYLTLWGSYYQNLDLTKGSVIVLKSVKYQQFNQRGNLSSTGVTIILDPVSLKVPKISILKQWGCSKDFDNFLLQEQEEQIQMYTVSLINQFLEAQIQGNQHNKSSLKTIQGYITNISLNSTHYPSCPASKCLKKMEYQSVRINYKCPSCYTETENPRYRYVLRGRLMDDFSSIDVTMFDEVASKLLQMTGNEFHSLSLEQQHAVLGSIFEELELQLTIQFKEKDGLVIPNVIINSIKEIDYQKATIIKLKDLEEIDQMNQISQLL